MLAVVILLSLLVTLSLSSCVTISSYAGSACADVTNTLSFTIGECLETFMYTSCSSAGVVAEAFDTVGCTGPSTMVTLAVGTCIDGAETYSCTCSGNVVPEPPPGPAYTPVPVPVPEQIGGSVSATLSFAGDYSIIMSNSNAVAALRSAMQSDLEYTLDANVAISSFTVSSIDVSFSATTTTVTQDELSDQVTDLSYGTTWAQSSQAVIHTYGGPTLAAPSSSSYYVNGGGGGSSGGMSTGAVIGLVIGLLALAGGAAGGIAYVVIMRSRRLAAVLAVHAVEMTGVSPTHKALVVPLAEHEL